MTSTTINVPRELLERLLDYDCAVAIRQNARHELRALLSAPSPAGVDGLEVVGTLRYFMDYPDSPHSAPGYITHQFNPASWDHAGEAAGEHKLCRLSDAQAIIDGLRGEVERLERAEKNDSIAYKAVLERQDELRAELAATKAQGVVIPAELDRAFITGESCDGVYRVVIQSEKLKEMQAVHSWLTSLNAAPAAPAADATVRQATDGGRNQSYEGLFDGETEEQRASRLAAHRTQGAV